MSNNDNDDQELLQKLKAKMKAIQEKEFPKIPMDCRCPLKMKHLPVHPCPYALNSIHPNEYTNAHETCEWFIVDEHSNYCFFVYNALNPKTHTLDEIAELTGTTIGFADSQIKKAFSLLKGNLSSQSTVFQFLK